MQSAGCSAGYISGIYSLIFQQVSPKNNLPQFPLITCSSSPGGRRQGLHTTKQNFSIINAPQPSVVCPPHTTSMPFNNNSRLDEMGVTSPQYLCIFQ